MKFRDVICQNNLIKFIMLAVLYIPFLLLVYYVYINIFRVDVVFYGSLCASLVALIFYAMILLMFALLKTFSLLEKFQILIIFFLIGYIFSISAPTVIDRSLSFYLLEKLQQRGGTIKLSKLEYVFVHEYMREHHLLDIRVTEQVESGTISVQGDCIKLTPFGEYVATFSRTFRAYFLPKRRLLRGQYTDALVDPFAQSEKDPGYRCNE